MQKNLRIQHLALTSVAALAITGCGGGGSGDNTADPGNGGPVMVNAFAYVQPIVASGASDTAEAIESYTEIEIPRASGGGPAGAVQHRG